MPEFAIETPRLILRSWRDADLEPFHAMSNDERVMVTLGPLMNREQAAAVIARRRAEEQAEGHCFWALERRADGAFLGFCGLVRGNVGPIISKVEIGWRLAHHAWGQGYAREAAEASLEWGFDTLADDAIWAITTPGNVRSWGLMKRLGMVRHDDLDFEHPSLPEGDPLKPHITYSISRSDWFQ